MQSYFTKIFGPKSVAIKTFLLIGIYLLGSESGLVMLLGCVFMIPTFLFLK